jgi:ABC-2 type transport system ATP-binding protein
VTGQFAGLDDFLTGRENLELVARLGRGTDGVSARVGDLIDRLTLDDIADRRVGELSGGSRRRIDLAASMVGSPSVLFLDEPTTGLDPAARAALWDTVAELNGNGATVVLTTQYLEEADRLANEIVLLDHGRVAARGTPRELKRLVGGKVITATLPTEDVAGLEHAPDEIRSVDSAYSYISYSIPDVAAAASLVSDLSLGGLRLADLDVASPTLDDVFSHLLLEGANT